MSGRVIFRNFRKPTQQVFRSLLKRRIDVRQGCHNVQVEDRIKVESVHHDDSPEPAPSQPIDSVILSQQLKRFQKGVECPLLAKYLFDSDRTDKRGKNHGDENQAGKQGFSRKDETVAEKGKGESKESRKNCARDGEKEGVRETLQVNRVPENLDDVGNGKGSVPQKNAPRSASPMGHAKNVKNSPVAAKTVIEPLRHAIRARSFIALPRQAFRRRGIARENDHQFAGELNLLDAARRSSVRRNFSKATS